MRSKPDRRNSLRGTDAAKKRASAGGTARAGKLTPAQRSKIAKKAARARWKK